jgi:hypothetical protein
VPVTAFNKHDVTLLQREQADPIEHVIDPLADIARMTVPTTLTGVAPFPASCVSTAYKQVRGGNCDNLDMAKVS